MKYMTKEWYETMQKTHHHLSLKVSKEAEAFSEPFFKTIYELEEKKWLKLTKEIFELIVNISPKEFFVKNIDGSPLKEEVLEKNEEECPEQYEQPRLNYVNRPPFDAERERKKFKQSLRRNIKYLKNTLPDEILKKVADIRVLALNYASDEVKKEISKYCENNEKIIKCATSAYQSHYEQEFKSNVPLFVKEMNLHDSMVLSCRRKGNDLLLTIDNTGGFTNICEIRFKNCNVIKKDKSLHGARFLYDEIYRCGERYEIHFLLEKNQLIDFIVSVENVEFKYN